MINNELYYDGGFDDIIRSYMENKVQFILPKGAHIIHPDTATFIKLLNSIHPQSNDAKSAVILGNLTNRELCNIYNELSSSDIKPIATIHQCINTRYNPVFNDITPMNVLSLTVALIKHLEEYSIIKMNRSFEVACNNIKAYVTGINDWCVTSYNHGFQLLTSRDVKDLESIENFEYKDNQIDFSILKDAYKIQFHNGGELYITDSQDIDPTMLKFMYNTHDSYIISTYPTNTGFIVKVYMSYNRVDAVKQLSKNISHEKILHYGAYLEFVNLDTGEYSILMNNINGLYK